MAFDTVPFAMDATTLDAEQLRRAVGTLIGPAGGIVTPGDLTVSQQSSPNMSVQIGTGQIWVPGTSTASQGPYYSRNGAPTTVVISAASASNPRVDTIIAQAIDKTYAGVLSQVQPAVVVGTPTPGVVAPPTTAAAALADGAGAVPASSVVLAYVLVPTAATSIVTADIANVVPLVVPSRALAAPTVPMTAQTRAIGTAYQPNTTRPTLVIVSANLPASATTHLGIYMDANSTPTTLVEQIQSNGAATSFNLPATFLVPAGFYYLFSADVGAPTISFTREFAL